MKKPMAERKRPPWEPDLLDEILEIRGPKFMTPEMKKYNKQAYEIYKIYS